MSTTTWAQSEKIIDSDGDGIDDEHDVHPFIAEIQEVSWQIRYPLTIGMKFNSSISEIQTGLSENEKKLLKQKTLKLGASFGLGADGSISGQSEVSADPRSLFGLKNTKASQNFGARFSASGNIAWNRQSQETATSVRRIVSEKQVAQRFEGLNIEFTVDFFNHSEVGYRAENLQIPIKADGNVVAIAQPVEANGPASSIRIPAGRYRAIPVLYRAEIESTQALSLLDIMQQRSPQIAIEESQGAIVPELGQAKADAIGSMARIRQKTNLLEVDNASQPLAFHIAKKDERSGKKLTFRDAFDAINTIVADESGNSLPVFVYTDSYLETAFGRDNSVAPLSWWHLFGRGSDELFGVPLGQDIDPRSELQADVRMVHRAELPLKMNRWYQIAKDSSPPKALPLLVAFEMSYRNGDLQKAVQYAKASSGLGDAQTQVALGVATLFGWGDQSVDPSKALELFEAAAADGNTEALVRMAFLASIPVNPKIDGSLAQSQDLKSNGLKILERVAAMGVAPALTRLGLHRLGNDEPLAAVELFQKAADQGDTTALVFLGLSHAGWMGGLEKNETRALELFSYGTEMGNPIAAAALSRAYFEGSLGLKKDPAKAAELLNKAQTNAFGFARGFIEKTFASHTENTAFLLKNDISAHRTEHLRFPVPKESRESIIWRTDPQFMTRLEGKNQEALMDPWGSEYLILMDLDYNGKIRIPEGEFPDAGVTLETTIAVWSSGPDRKSGTDDDIITWDSPDVGNR